MRTPLHVAVIFASDKLCELLLKYGADVNAKDVTMTVQHNLHFTTADTH